MKKSCIFDFRGKVQFAGASGIVSVCFNGVSLKLMLECVLLRLKVSTLKRKNCNFSILIAMNGSISNLLSIIFMSDVLNTKRYG